MIGWWIWMGQMRIAFGFASRGAFATATGRNVPWLLFVRARQERRGLFSDDGLTSWRCVWLAHRKSKRSRLIPGEESHVSFDPAVRILHLSASPQALISPILIRDLHPQSVPAPA
jgi:hypothetical protein